MKALKTFLVVLLTSSLLTACDKIDFKDLFDKKPKKEVTKIDLPVNGAQEVPVVVTSASGLMNVSYIKKEKRLYYKVTWNNLTGVPVGAHIHGESTKGVNAAVKHPFTDLIPKTVSGSFTNSVLVDEVSIKEEGLLKGLYYLNIHTAKFPGGEIRGQIEF